MEGTLIILHLTLATKIPEVVGQSAPQSQEAVLAGLRIVAREKQVQRRVRPTSGLGASRSRGVTSRRSLIKLKNKVNGRASIIHSRVIV